MSGAVEIRTIEPQPAVVIRSRAMRENLGAEFGVVIPEVYNHVVSKGVTPTGMPFTRYFAFSDAGVEFESGVPVAGPVEEGARTKNIQLPGGRVAFIRHIGPYEKLESAYRRLEEWFAGSEYEPGGPPWEVYVTDPGAEPDSSKWITDIFQPVTW